MIKILLILLLLCGCNVSDLPSQGCDILSECSETTISSTTMSFKKQYEAYNDRDGYRAVTIPEEVPFVRIEAAELEKLLDEKQTFYIYFGDEACPWCRSVIEMAIAAAKETGIDTICYLEAWDDEGHERFRNRFEVIEDELQETEKGAAVYYRLIEEWKDQLSQYLLNYEGEQVDMFQKRIYIPAFAYVKEGKLERYTTGISRYQKDADSELDERILQDETKLFEAFFGKEQS